MKNFERFFHDRDIRFAIDNLTDGLKDSSLLVLPVFDTVENRQVLLIARRIPDKANPDQVEVLPIARLEPDSQATVERYAPPSADGNGWDYRKIKGGAHILLP